MSKTIRVPIWTEGDTGPRVMIEETDFAKQAALASILRGCGYSVLTCDGPDAKDHQCSLVELGHCDGVAQADVVVHSMRPNDPRNRAVLQEILTRHAEIPVIVEAPRPYVESRPEDFEGCTVVFQPMTRQVLIDAVESVLGNREA